MIKSKTINPYVDSWPLSPPFFQCSNLKVIRREELPESTTRPIDASLSYAVRVFLQTESRTEERACSEMAEAPSLASPFVLPLSLALLFGCFLQPVPRWVEMCIAGLFQPTLRRFTRDMFKCRAKKGQGLSVPA